MKPIKIILCDDYKELVDGYKERLELEPDMIVPAVFYSGKECLDNISSIDADILLLDIQMETQTIGIEIVSEIKKLSPNIKIIMLSSYNDDEYIFDAFSSGAVSYVLKDDTTDTLLSTIRDVYHDRFVISNDVAKQILNKANKLQIQQKSLLFLFEKLRKLTKTEFEVLSALYKGMTYSEIAQVRFVEENTVRKIASNILHKFNVRNMKELLALITDTTLFEFFK